MSEVIREQDVLIATAAVPGRRAPILVTRDMVLAMRRVRSLSISPPNAAGIAR